MGIEDDGWSDFIILIKSHLLLAMLWYAQQFLIISLCARDASFHILITSYQLLVGDEKYFRRVKWQYMVLDEAQAIKSSNRC